jgi:cytochrome b6-f complex subunit 4
VAKHGPQEKQFYPDYLVEIVAAIFMTLGLLYFLAMLFPPLIGREINFLAAYQPKPEWYFLWLYQVVRYFPGRWSFIGTAGLPILAVLILLCIPRIDRGSAGSRKIASFCFSFLLAGFSILCLLPIFLQ